LQYRKGASCSRGKGSYAVQIVGKKGIHSSSREIF
jgi:hypothetical protein